MPEGDTVWRTARRLNQALAGEVLTRSDFRVPAYATLDLRGRRVSEVVSRGKHLLTRVQPDLTIHTHLKMEGSWHLYRPGSRWRGPDHQVRLVLTTAAWVAVGFRLGVVKVLATADEVGVVGHLGPDLLGPDWDAKEAVRRIRREPGRPLGAALLDQRNLAGLGNIYHAEVCFIAGVSPWLPVAEVADLPAVVSTARRVLSANTERVAATTTGDTRPGQQLWVYGRAGEPCRRCGTPVRQARRADDRDERQTYWCPRCQPATGPARSRSGGGDHHVGRVG
jgi:endonuclease-8